MNAVYTAATAARHVALEVIRWRAKTLESKDKEIIPDDIGFVTTAEVVYHIPPEQRTDEQVQALVFKWLEDGVLSIVPRRDTGREQKGRKQTNLDHQGCGSAAKPVYQGQGIDT